MRVCSGRVGHGFRVAVLAAAAASVSLAAAGAAAADDVLVPAVWKERRIDFVYVGQTSRYSCNGIRDKLRAMLRTLGARRDINAVAIGCFDYSGQRQVEMQSPGVQSPTVHLTFSTPAMPGNGAKPVLDAHYEAFSITVDAFRNMELGDCELVEEFMQQIVPKLATRNIRQDITCVPYQLSGSHYSVRGEVLKSRPAVAPAAGSRK